jgi:hypothetical protein
VYENRVLRKFGPKRKAVAEDWRRLHNEKLHNMHTLSNTWVIKVVYDEKYGTYSTHRRYEICIQGICVDGRTILDWIFREAGWECVDWTHLTQDRNQWQDVVNTVMNLRVS